MPSDHDNPMRWWPRFSLTSFLLSVTVIVLAIGWRADAIRLSRRAERLTNDLRQNKKRLGEAEVRVEVAQEYVNGLYSHAGKPLQDWMKANRPSSNPDWETFPQSSSDNKKE